MRKGNYKEISLYAWLGLPGIRSFIQPSQTPNSVMTLVNQIDDINRNVLINIAMFP